MAEDDITRLLQNAEFEEILPEERNADITNFDKQTSLCNMIYCSGQYSRNNPGADPGFQVRGGVLKKIAPSRGRRENFWGNSCEKSRFYAKKIIFFQF